MKNPWLNISPEDYEGHMSSSNVGQLEALSKIFGSVIQKIHPKSIMILGSSTGNGFEHLTGEEKIIGVDINPVYLDQCKNRFAEKLPNMELICADLDSFDYTGEKLDLIHAALIFEYVDVEKLLSKIFCWLKQERIFSAVIQMESRTSAAISENEFSSLKILEPIHNLVSPDLFISKSCEAGFKQTDSCEVLLPGEKKFKVMMFQKVD